MPLLGKLAGAFFGALFNAAFGWLSARLQRKEDRQEGAVEQRAADQGKENAIKDEQLKDAADRPRDRDDLAGRLRDGSF